MLTEIRLTLRYCLLLELLRGHASSFEGAPPNPRRRRDRYKASQEGVILSRGIQYVGNILQVLFGRNMFLNVTLDFRRVLNKIDECGIEIFGCEIRKGLEQWCLCVVESD